MENTRSNKPIFVSERIKNSYSHVVAAPCEAVFPLLCPKRETEWLTDWKYSMIYSESGIAELDAIFSTWYGEDQIWYVSRYEPCSKIEFIRNEGKKWIERLSVTLTDVGNGQTNVYWEQVTTTLSEEGKGIITFWEENFLPIRKSVEKDLNRYFESGFQR
jgi:hypothetical protein